MTDPKRVTPTPPAALIVQVRDIPGVSPKLASTLAGMGLTNVGKLVAHLPHRYDRESPEATIDRLEPGELVSTRGSITACRPSGFGRRTRFEAVLNDGTGRLDLVWFNAPYLVGKLHPGARLAVKGKARTHNHGLQLANPSYRVLRDDEPEIASGGSEGGSDGELGDGVRLVPVYPATEGATSRDITRVIEKVLPAALDAIEDHLPESFRKDRALPELREAYRAVHAPKDQSEADNAMRRLAFDELLQFQLAVFMKKARLRGSSIAPAFVSAEPVQARVLSLLPHEPTPAQARVMGELRADLTTDRPMNRLLQGDVGSGKTMVALYAMLLAVASGHQGALMAPTEILAEQHHRSITEALAVHDAGRTVSVRLVTGSIAPAERHAILENLASGALDLVIGTHALLTDRVRFKSLGLAIIDEQHRFGVAQRAALRDKATAEQGGIAQGVERTPHVLVMTATPIPRTMSMTLFGDLDVSTIDALPIGRAPVKTRVVAQEDRAEAYAELRSRLDAGGRGYVVTPSIDGGANATDNESDNALVGVRALADELRDGPLAGKQVAVLHGRLDRATRDATMERFRAGAIDVLVATTVIEVGVDVPEADTIVIEQAERFGLSQLHQLRGRVGRGSTPGVCLLVSSQTTPESERRLGAMAATNDGFELAEEDFFLRGAGELFGTRQSGGTQFRVADLQEHRHLLQMARRDAQKWVESSPSLAEPGESLLRRRVLRAHGEAFGLGDVG